MNIGEMQPESSTVCGRHSKSSLKFQTLRPGSSALGLLGKVGSTGPEATAGQGLQARP
jgi:hypothetical protein